MQYKLSFLLTMIGQFLVSFNVFLGVLFLMQRFHQVKGYHFSDVVLCYATVLMSYSIAEMFMRGFDTFASTISNFEFDRMLLRPRSCVFQLYREKWNSPAWDVFSRQWLCLSMGLLNQKYNGTLEK